MARKAELPSLRNETWLRDKHLQKVMSILNNEDGEVRVVGGAVRNALLGLAVADVDRRSIDTVGGSLRPASPPSLARRSFATGETFGPFTRLIC